MTSCASFVWGEKARTEVMRPRKAPFGSPADEATSESETGTSEGVAAPSAAADISCRCTPSLVLSETRQNEGNCNLALSSNSSCSCSPRCTCPARLCWKCATLYIGTLRPSSLLSQLPALSSRFSLRPSAPPRCRVVAPTWPRRTRCSSTGRSCTLQCYRASSATRESTSRASTPSCRTMSGCMLMVKVHSGPHGRVAHASARVQSSLARALQTTQP